MPATNSKLFSDPLRWTQHLRKQSSVRDAVQICPMQTPGIGHLIHMTPYSVYGVAAAGVLHFCSMSADRRAPSAAYYSVALIISHPTLLNLHHQNEPALLCQLLLCQMVH